MESRRRSIPATMAGCSRLSSRSASTADARLCPAPGGHWGRPLALKTALWPHMTSLHIAVNAADSEPAHVRQRHMPGAPSGAWPSGGSRDPSLPPQVSPIGQCSFRPTPRRLWRCHSTGGPRRPFGLRILHRRPKTSFESSANLSRWCPNAAAPVVQAHAAFTRKARVVGIRIRLRVVILSVVRDTFASACTRTRTGWSGFLLGSSVRE